MQQRSAEWYRARCGRITGSRFARAMAPRHSSTYRGLVDELVAERLSGRCMDGGRVSAAMQWGIDHEHSARRWYEREHGRTVCQVGFVVHPHLEFVGVSPDGLVDEDGLIEIKCPQIKNFSKVIETRELPPQYRWQVQGQLWVCERVWLDFVCFYPPGRGIALRIQGDDDDGDRLEERCREIHREVERRLGGRAPHRFPKMDAGTESNGENLGGPSSAESRQSRNQPAEESLPWGWIIATVVALWVLFRLF